MRVSFANNTLVVVTGITKETIEKGISDLTARDEKGNALYRVSVTKEGTGSLDVNGMKCNSFIDGKAAVVIVESMDATQASVQKKYGEALIAAAKYTEVIADAADAKEAEIAALFTDAQ